MAFTLQIRFTGLFLFVPDFHTRGLHVVLPMTGDELVEKHVAKIGVEKVSFTDFELEDLSLDLTAPGEGTILPPREATDLEELTNARLPRSLIDPAVKPNETVHARIFLPPATSIEADGKALWRIPGHGKRPMTNRILWTLEGVRDAAVKVLRAKYTGSSPAALEFKPTGKMLKLCVRYLPKVLSHTHTDPEAKHFQAYYRVLGKMGKNPFLAQTVGSEPDNPCVPELKATPGGPPPSPSTFTCMVSQVRVG
jgi:hypothetical protein